MDYKILKNNFLILISLIIISSIGFIGLDFLVAINNKKEQENNFLKKNQNYFKNVKEAIEDKDFNKKFTLSYYPDYATNIISLKSDIIPINGISNIKTYYCNEQGFLSNYFSDRHGFNNKDENYKNSILDLALLGDSFVQGACTNKSSIQQNLSKIHKDLSIIAFAQGGAGPLLELAYLKEYAIKYKPKLVFWFWVGNDLRNLEDELQSPLRFYMRKNYTQKLFDPKTKIKADEIVKQILNSYKIENLNNQKNNNFSSIKFNLKIILKKYLPKTFILLKSLKEKTNYKLINTENRIISREEVLTRNIPHKEDLLMIKAADEILLEAKDTVESYGGKFAIIYLGFGGWNSKPFLNKNLEKTHYLQKTFLSNFTNIHGLKFYDLDKDIDDIFLKKDHIKGHFSDEGYKLVSDIVSKYIQEYEKEFN